MDFLLDPNVAYLVLLAGALFSLMAIVTPGTGLLETAAVVLLAMAGYAVYNLRFSWWALVMVVLSIVPFIYAIQRPRREAFLAVAVLLLVVGSVFIFAEEDGGPAVDPLVAVAASAGVGGFLWIAVRKSMQAMHARPAHDLGALRGQLGESRTAVGEAGSVQVAGELWSARSDRTIASGRPVRVVGRDGFVLIVEEDSGGKAK